MFEPYFLSVTILLLMEEASMIMHPIPDKKKNSTVSDNSWAWLH